MVRQQWISLDGLWDFAFDDRDEGRAAGWYLPGAAAFNRRIQVPFPPESAASGVGDDAPHLTLWYRRTIELTGGPRWILHFGAVDQEADIYVDGRHVGGHTGGQTAFSIDITNAVDPAVDKHTLVVRAYDDPTDTEVPRGKQDWRNQPHFIWYRRTSGIWRTVWLEQVPSLHITSIEWHPNSDAATVRAVIRLSAQPTEPAAVTVAVAANGQTLGSTVVTAHNARVIVTLELPPLRNAQEREQYFWEPDHPVLLDANIVLTAGATVDRVASYFAFRTVGVQRDAFLLNNRPWFVRAVLEQGYWTDSHLTPPSVAALRQEVDLIKDLGFNTARIHQKVEDPRFLYWADRLGLMVWVETAAAYEYTPRAASRITAEWIEIVEQHRNHPCVVTWVPVNESWGVQK